MERPGTYASALIQCPTPRAVSRRSSRADQNPLLRIHSLDELRKAIAARFTAKGRKDFGREARRSLRLADERPFTRAFLAANGRTGIGAEAADRLAVCLL